MIELDRGYLTIARFAGDPDRLAELHRRAAPVMNRVGCDHGLIAHVAAPTARGLVMVNLWPSAEGSDSASRDPRRAAQLRAIGLRPEDISREHHDVSLAVLFGAGRD